MNLRNPNSYHRNKRGVAYGSRKVFSPYTSFDGTKSALFSLYRTNSYFSNSNREVVDIPFDGSTIHRSVDVALSSGTVTIQQPGVYYVSFRALKHAGYPIKVQITKNGEVVSSGQNVLGTVTCTNTQYYTEGVNPYTGIAPGGTTTTTTVLGSNDVWDVVSTEALLFLDKEDKLKVQMYSDGGIYDDISHYTNFLGYLIH